MIRPQTANPSKLSSILSRRPRPNFNESSNKIADNFAQKPQDENIEQHEQSMNEVKSQNPTKHTQKQIDKHDLAVMLMKFELEKMGFGEKEYWDVVQGWVRKRSLQGVGIGNLRGWVLRQKSGLVELLISKREENLELEVESVQGHNQKLEKLQPVVPQQISIRKKGHISSQQSQIKEEKTPRPKIGTLKIEEVEKKPKIKLESLVCPICLVETTSYLKRKCGHVFCKDCIRGYLEESMEGGNFLVDCPELDCHEKLSQEEAAEVLNTAQLNRFIRFKQKLELENNPNNKFCNRPDCGQLLIDKDKKLFCKACNIAFCSTCQEPEHAGRQCGEILQQSMDQAYKSFNIKKCPSCSSPIQKMDGCNHMTCKKCKAEFCWICLEKYTPYHYRIYNCCGCPGLQFDQAEQRGFKKFLQVLFFIFLPLLIALTIAVIFLVLPLYMLFDLFTKPCRWLSDYDQKCQMAILNVICCFLPDCLIAFIGYFALLPRSALACIFISPIEYFMIIVNIGYNVL